MTHPRISVAMCTYNGSRYLREQLESIASQSLLPHELVICDDGSVDGTKSLLTDFAAGCSFPVRIFSNEKNLGSTKNFEQAIGLCEGDVIALADQDDIWKSAKLENLWAVLEQHPGAGYVFSDAEMIDEQGAALGCTLWDALQLQGPVARFSPSGQLAVLLKSNVVTGAGMAFRASLKDFVLPISSRWVHDYWIAVLGSTMSYGVPLPECLFLYRRHPSQQIGMRYAAKTLSERYEISLSVTQEEYQGKVKAFRDLLERVRSASSTIRIPGENMDLLHQKEIHLARRAAIRSASGISKMAMVLSEALTGRYQRFSESWRSVGRDFFPTSLLSSGSPQAVSRRSR